ncbi:MAG TPA: DUF488 domain-containing protein [bacterium]|nr:DUF488 domain-containing protein [bacterium]
MIYTIGHSDHPIGDFIALLKRYAITCLCDIRSTPYSKRHPQFNAENLKRELPKHGIRYRYLGKELGGRPPATVPIPPSTCQGEGRGEVGTGRSEEFNHGISLVAEELAKGETLVLMCAEKDPADCHRSHLVAPGLIAAGIAVRHILYDGELAVEQMTLSGL